MPTPLPFGAGADPFAGYDAPPGSPDPDLAGFDAATGVTTIPAGAYSCRVVRGELTFTNARKLAYRLELEVIEPSEHYGFTVQRWYLLADNASQNRAKAALGPLGLTSSAQLKAPFPPPGRDVYVRALITIRPPRNGYPESNDIERLQPCDAPAGATAPPANSFAVAIDATADSEPVDPAQEEGSTR